MLDLSSTTSAVLLSLMALSAIACSMDDQAGPPWPDDEGSKADDPSAPAPSRIAPADERPDAIGLDDGSNSVPNDAGDVVFRVDLQPGTHASFDLRFSASASDVSLRLERWDPEQGALVLGESDAGPGLRVLAALPRASETTYWVTVSSAEGLTGATLALATEGFDEGAQCADDCRRVLQLPTPDDRLVDGYYSGETSVLYQQFGRRDLLMALRHAGRKLAENGLNPLQAEDLSNWNKTSPPGHASHRSGEDVDIELFADDGINVWRDHDFFCRSRNQRCVAGTVQNFDARATAIMLGGFFESKRVTLAFLDQALIKEVRKTIPDLVADGVISVFAGDAMMGSTLMHFANHENHAHLRFRDTSHGFWGGELPPAEGEALGGEGVFAP